jgi:L-alanine-DL-glutamate epimerase-like enolase superfamily enzyme
MNELLSFGAKREMRERLVHDAARAPAGSRRRFLQGAAASLVAMGAGGAAAMAAARDAAPASLKITDLKTTILRLGGQDWTVLVELPTNQGIVGLGQTTFRAKPKVIQPVLENILKPALIGRSPFDNEFLWMQAFLDNTKYGSGLHIMAMSAIDMALWDLMGKAVDQPVWRLLGGKFRDKVEVYASRAERKYDDNDPKGVAEMLVKDVVPAGFRGLKTHTHPGANLKTTSDARMDVDPTLEEVGEIRRLAGPKFKIMVDVNNAYTPIQAIKVGHKLEELDAFWIEEPVAVYNYSGLAQVADALELRVAAGEQQFARWEFYRLIAEGHVAVIQPDVAICGGITEMRKIAAIASVFDVSIASHNTLNGIPTTAALHFWAATPNARYPQEYDFHAVRPDYGARMVKDPVKPQDGFLTPPDKPGLGVELNPDEIAKLRAIT